MCVLSRRSPEVVSVNRAHRYRYTRRYGTLHSYRRPTSSSCGRLVGFGHLEGPLDSCKKKLDPHFFYRGPSIPPPHPPPPPLPLVQSIFFFFFLPPFFIGGPPPIPPPPRRWPPTPCRVFFYPIFFIGAPPIPPSAATLPLAEYKKKMAAILNFGVDVKMCRRKGGGPVSVFYVDNKTRWHTLPRTHAPPTAFSVPKRKPKC